MANNKGRTPGIYDYHVHTNFSCDSEMTMQAMCLAAIDEGLSEIGFSDHFDLHPNEPCLDYLDAEAWWESFHLCREKFSGALTLRAGVEVGEAHRFSDHVTQLLEQYPWDFVLGSLHWVGDLCIFDADYFHADQTEAYEGYFLELEQLVENGHFDILAHFDVVKRYGYDYYGDFIPTRYEGIIRRILRKLVQQGRSLEVNTATLRRSIQHPSPDASILRWYREEGGRQITLGSDAHHTADVGFALPEMMQMVRSIGFEGLTQYSARQGTIIDFDDQYGS